MYAPSRIGSINDPYNTINLNFPSLSQANPVPNFPSDINSMNMGKNPQLQPDTSQLPNSTSYGICLF